MKRSGAWVKHNNWWVSAGISFLWAFWSFLNDFNANQVPYSGWHSYIKTTLGYAQSYSFILFILIAPTSLYWFWKVKTDKNWTAINKLLNHTRDKVFTHCNGEPKEHHQVTLFQYKRYAWRAGYITQSISNLKPSNANCGWLIPVARTGHMGRNSGSIFPVNDKTESCTGVCGLAWATGDIAEQLNLPRVTKDSAEKVITKEARDSNCPAELVTAKVRKARPETGAKKPCLLPRSIVAFPIGNGENSEAPEYILVFDSRNRDGIPSTIRDDYSVVNQLLGSLLGGE